MSFNSFRYYDDTCHLPKDYLPPILTRAVELKRAYMRRKIKAKRKAELNEKKMLRKVKQANRKICKFGYDSSSRLRGRSAHRKFRGGNSSGEESPSRSEDSVEECSCLESFEADSIDSGSEIMGGMSSMV